MSFDFENTTPNFKRKDAVDTKHALTPEINKIPGLIESEIEKKYGKIEKIEIKNGELKVAFVTPEPISTQTSNPDTTINTAPTTSTEAWTDEDEEKFKTILTQIENNQQIIENTTKRLIEIDTELTEIKAVEAKTPEPVVTTPENLKTPNVDQEDMVYKKGEVIKYIQQELARVRRNLNTEKIKFYEKELVEIENEEKSEDIINNYWENLQHFKK